MDAAAKSEKQQGAKRGRPTKNARRAEGSGVGVQSAVKRMHDWEKARAKERAMAGKPGAAYQFGPDSFGPESS
jgi:hypothetical protein